jgi:Tol biopolymer transport system component
MAGVVVALLALTAAYFAGKGQTAPAMSPRFHQLTFQRGSIFGAKFAPDGQSILYSAAWNGAQKQQVYTTRTDALMSRAIDLPDSQVASISSKGEMAILRRIEDRPPFRGVLAIVPLTGGAPRELMADVVDAAWSPSGDSLAVVNVVGPEQRLEYPVGKVIHRTSTGGITDLKVSPDGKRVAFFDHPNFGDSRGFVAVVDAAGKVTRLTQEWADLTGLAWSNSGKEVWFTGSDVGINSALYAVELSGRMRDLLHIPGRLHLFDIGKDGQVLMTNEAQRQEVYARRMGQERETDLSWFDWTLGRALSQDSQWIVLEEDGEGGGADYTVFLRKTDGSPAIRLGNGMGLDISPDAKWVASTPVKQPAPTVLLPTGAGQPMSLGDGALFHTSRLKFLPDGKSVIMIATQPGGAPRTYLQQLDSSPPKPFGPEGFTGTFVSPDGRYVLGRKDGAFGIVAFADSMKFQPVSIQPSETVGGWTADSRSVYVGDNSSMPVKVYAMDIGTGQRHLHHQHSPGDLAGIAGAGTGLVTPDGKFYAYTVARVLSYLYVVRGLQ